MKRLITCLVLMIIFSGMLLVMNRNTMGETAGTMKILESASGTDSIILGDESTQMPNGGYPFTVNVTIDGQFDFMYTFQVTLRFDKTKVNFTSASIPTKDPTFVFFDRLVVTSGEPLIDDRFSQYAFVTLGASLILETTNVSKGLLCTVNFVAQRVGNSTIDFSITDVGGTGVDTTFLLKLIPGREDPVDIAFATESFSISTFAAPSPPVPLIEFTPAYPDLDVNVTFYAVKSYDPVGNISSYFWDFDDGTTFATANVTTIVHVFNESRTYYVRLTAYNNFNMSSLVAQEVQVGHVPLVNFTYSPQEVMPNHSVTFDGSLSSDSDGTIALYVWNFGDNTSSVNSTDGSATYDYATKGVYTVWLTVYDNNGLHNMTSQEIFIGRRPVVLVTFDPENPSPLDVVSFNASGTHAGDVDDQITMLRWEFGDYNITDIDIHNSDLVDPFVVTHIYYSGHYSGNVTAFDNNGLYTTYTFQMDVQTPATPNYTLYLVVAVAAIAIATFAVIVAKRRKK